jgi:transaldolase/glucose-6-phosphate isomerase
MPNPLVPGQSYTFGIPLVPRQSYTFGIVKAAQARGDYDILAERGRRALWAHITGDLGKGLGTLSSAVEQALQ